MYYIMYIRTGERILGNIDQVAIYLINGWKLYGYTDNEKQAYFLWNECQNC